MKIIDPPSYVVINDEKRPLKDRHILRTPTKAICVPLSKRDQEAEGFLARIIQHEVDHIRGILFIDRQPKEAS